MSAASNTAVRTIPPELAPPDQKAARPFADAIAALPTTEGIEAKFTAVKEQDFSASFYRSDGQVCAELTTADGSTSFTCGELAEFTTGTAYLAYQAKQDDPVIVVGVVPDEVSDVTVDGVRVSVTNNTWVVRTSAPSVKVVAVGSNGATATAELTVGAFTKG